MAKTRFSISVAEERAVKIKAAAARAGQDVSTYMWRAAMAAVDRDAHVATVFADIDGRITAAEYTADDTGSWPPAPVGPQLTAEERTEITTRWDAFFGAITHGAA